MVPHDATVGKTWQYCALRGIRTAEGALNDFMMKQVIRQASAGGGPILNRETQSSRKRCACSAQGLKGCTDCSCNPHHNGRQVGRQAAGKAMEILARVKGDGGDGGDG